MINRFLSAYLDPISRLQELIYGVLIVMTFTMAFKAVGTHDDVTVGAQEVSQMFLAAFGCTVAWGFIDGVMSVLTNLASRGQANRMVRAVQAAPDHDAALAAIAGELDDTLDPITSDEERQRIYAGVLVQVKDNTLQPVGVERDDIYGAIGLVIISIIATLPVLVPLLFVRDPNFAIRLSNIIAIVMLFAAGFYYGKAVGTRPLINGLTVAGIGVIMVLVAIPLGG